MSRMLHERLRRERAGGAGAGAARWRQWAHTLADRYGQVAGRLPRPDMALVPALPAAAPGQRHQHLHWNLSRHLRLAVHPVLVALARARPAPGPARAAAPGPAAPGTAAGGGGGGRVEAAPAPLERVVAGAAALPGDAGPGTPPALLLVETCRRTLERVVEERRRVERWSPAPRPGARPPAVPDRLAGGGPGVAAPALAWPPAPPAAAVPARRRRAEGPPPPAGGPPPGWVPAAGAAPSRPGPGWGEPAAAARIDLGRLTDQVVRQIDREIIAHRERMGRI